MGDIYTLSQAIILRRLPLRLLHRILSLVHPHLHIHDLIRVKSQLVQKVLGVYDHIRQLLFYMLQVILLIVPLEALQEFCRLDDDGFRKVRGRMELLPFLLPFLPHLRLIPQCGLSPVSYNRRPDHGRIFQNLL